MSSVYHNVLKERKPPVVDEIIPARTAGAFTLKKGQFLRVIDVMGKQVSDTTYYNLNNLKERSCPGATDTCFPITMHEHVLLTWCGGCTLNMRCLGHLWKLDQRPILRKHLQVVFPDPAVWNGLHITFKCFRVYNGPL